MTEIFRSQNHLTEMVRDTTDGIERFEVFTSLEPLILTQDPDTKGANVQHVASGQDLSVYGDVIRIRGPIELPGRAVQIHARILQVEKDSKGQSAAISVNGSKGPKPPLPKMPQPTLLAAKEGFFEKRFLHIVVFDAEHGKNGKAGSHGLPGAPGPKAGSIMVNCELFESKSAVKLTAIGGTGGQGQNGQGGQAGQAGGNGYPGVVGFPMGIGMIKGTKGGNGGTGGKGGMGGTGGRGGNGGEITVNTIIKPTASFNVDTSAGKMGSTGLPGSGGSAGKGGSNGKWLTASQDLMTPNVQWVFPSSRNGAVGNKGDKKLNPTNPAKPGSKEVREGGVGYEELAVLGSAVPQRIMMLQKVRSAYLSGDPKDESSFNPATTLLNWLIRVTDCFTDLNLTPQSKLSVIQIAQLKKVNDQCQKLAMQLRLGKSYFGRFWNFAPRTSYQSLADELKYLSDHLKLLEKTSFDYFTHLKTTETAGTLLNEGISQASNLIYNLEISARTLKDQTDKLLKDIKKADAMVSEEQQSFVGAIAKLDSVLRQKGLLGPAEIAGAIKGMSVPEDFSGVASVVTGAVKLIKDQVDTMEEIDFEVNRIEKFGDRISSLVEVSNMSKDTAGGFLVVASQKRFDEALKKYKDVLAADDLRDALERFIMVCMTRNSLILDRSGVIARRADILHQIEQNKQLVEQTQLQLAESSRPDLPEMSAFMDSIYQDAKNQFLEQLYYAGRAYTFWSLKEYDILKSIPGMNHTLSLTHATLENERIRLMKAYATEMEGRGAEPQRFPPDDTKDVSGVIFKVDDNNNPGAISQLRSFGRAMIHIPAPQQDTSIKDNPFAGKALVRITKIRAWLYGLSDPELRLKIRMGHSGTHYLVGLNGEESVLYSSTVTRDFEYTNLEHEGEITHVIYMDGDIGEKDKQKRDYALVSPFTTWRVSIDKNLNPDLDLNKLQAIELEFFGESFPF